jgi:hypothetical protein
VEQVVRIKVVRGAGRVAVAEQPVAANEFSAVVRIDPAASGPELYEIDFFWNLPAGAVETRSDTDGVLRSGEMTWTGTVEGQVLVEIRDGNASTRVLRGGAVSTARADFMAPMPRRAMKVRAEQIGGRGEVKLVEQPSARNNYAAVVRISDKKAGASQYTFRLMWGVNLEAKP